MRHKNIINLLDIMTFSRGRPDAAVYLVTEIMDFDLPTLISQAREIPPPQLVRVPLCVLAARSVGFLVT